MRRQEEQLVGALFDVLEAEGHGEARQRLLDAYESGASEGRDELIERLITELVAVLNEQLGPREGAAVLTDAIEFLFDRLVSVVEVAPIAIVVVDADGAVQLWNAGAERLFGWSEADALGGRLVATGSDATGPFGDSLSRLRRGDRLTGVETRHPHRDGSLLDIRYWAAPLRDGDGGFTGATYVATDVGERKRREQRLTVLNRVLRHNIRNDVNVVTGHLEALAAERPDGDPHVEAMERRLSGIVDLSDAARRVERLQASDDEAGRRAFELSELVADRVEEFAAAHPDAAFDIDAPDGVEAVAHELLPYALDNLLENAAEHCAPSPRVRVTVRAERDGALVTVDDDGPGLPTHEREVLTRADETQLTHSTGVGLWLVRWIVRASGGELRVDGNDLGGTAVTVALRG
ncbi:ATP-binding protein [Halorubrum rutilum]|uniref:histidine kinase n=1 Tax=Halorubrum rutilum TaxID=1364933 RepID=A0ABD6AL73_9EURY|nr:ATP-binding protein [Halorubrum rutilum]